MDSVLQRPLFGDWGLRKDLSRRGIDLVAHYISETAANTAGIGGTGTDYAQQVDIGASFDLGKLGVWSGAIARLALSDRAGHSLADRTGSFFAYQEIYGQGQNLRIDEISLEKNLLGGGLALKAGFYPLGNDFATMPYVCNFTNVAICGHPQSLPTNSGWSDGPAGRWGGRAKWAITDSIHLQIGLFDVNPEVTRAQDGFKLSLSGSTGFMVPVEISYQLGTKPEDYAGTYKVGGYYDSSAAPDLANPALALGSRSGYYLEASQQIFKTGPGLRNGLAIFGIFTSGDRDTAKFKFYYEAGCAYRGLIPGRELDLLSVGWVRTDVNPRLQMREAATGTALLTNEQLVEFNYTAQVAPWLQIRPGVQYDVRPGAASTHPNTWVYGLQIKATL